jgi:hypothetical protein
MPLERHYSMAIPPSEVWLSLLWRLLWGLDTGRYGVSLESCCDTIDLVIYEK